MLKYARSLVAKGYPGSWKLAGIRVIREPGFVGIQWEFGVTSVAWQTEFAKDHQEPEAIEATWGQ